MDVPQEKKKNEDVGVDYSGENVDTFSCHPSINETTNDTTKDENTEVKELEERTKNIVAEHMAKITSILEEERKKRTALESKFEKLVNEHKKLKVELKVEESKNAKERKEDREEISKLQLEVKSIENEARMIERNAEKSREEIRTQLTAQHQTQIQEMKNALDKILEERIQETKEFFMAQLKQVKTEHDQELNNARTYQEKELRNGIQGVEVDFATRLREVRETLERRIQEVKNDFTAVWGVFKKTFVFAFILIFAIIVIYVIYRIFIFYRPKICPEKPNVLFLFLEDPEENHTEDIDQFNEFFGICGSKVTNISASSMDTMIVVVTDKPGRSNEEIKKFYELYENRTVANTFVINIAEKGSGACSYKGKELSTNEAFLFKNKDGGLFNKKDSTLDLSKSKDIELNKFKNQKDRQRKDCGKINVNTKEKLQNHVNILSKNNDEL